MSKEKSYSETEIQQAQDTLNLLALGQTAPLTYEQAFEILENADPAKMKLVNADVLKLSEMEPGVYSYLFEGFEPATFDGKSMEVARFRDKTGRSYVCPATVVVNSLKTSNILQLPAYVKIKLKGMKKGANGHYADVDIFVL